MWEYIKSTSQNLDTLTLVIAVLGWIFALWLQQRGAKQQHKIQIRYEIYKQFVHLHKEIQDSINKLNAHSHPPFVLMESSMIPFQLGLKREYKDIWLPYSEQDCVFEGEKKWTSFTQELFNDYFKCSEKLLQFSYIFEDWEGALEPLLPTMPILSVEIKNQKKIIFEQISEFQSYASKHSHDWRKWDQKEVEKITQLISESAMRIGLYMGDFMVLIHNELLSSYFGHKRQIRKTLDPKYKVLMKDGVIENVDHKLVENMEGWKANLFSLVNAYPGDNKTINEIASIKNDRCPSCGTELMVMDTKCVSAGTLFSFACGHSVTI